MSEQDPTLGWRTLAPGQIDKEFLLLAGRYSGPSIGVGAVPASLEVRIDPDRNVVSGDLFEPDEAGDDAFQYSFRSESVMLQLFDGRLRIVCPSDVTQPHASPAGVGPATHGAIVKAMLELEKEGAAWTARLKPYNYFGLTENPSENPYKFALSLRSTRVRTVALEVRHTADVDRPRVFAGDFAPETVEAAFANASIEIATQFSAIALDPAAALAGDNAWSDEELHQALISSTPEERRRAWKVRLLYASQAAIYAGDSPPLGKLFDTGDDFPRQGVAIFVRPLEASYADAQERRRIALYTTVHELGHAFNLLHSFEADYASYRERAARPGALSWMNYPRSYPLGELMRLQDWNSNKWDGKKLFWRDFERVRNFDREEILHLRHGAFDDVAMGGPWAGRKRSTDAFLPVEPNDGLELELAFPGAGADPSVPVQIEQFEQPQGSIWLHNRGTGEAIVPRGCSVQSNRVALLIQGPGRGPVRQFRAVAYSCPGDFVEAEGKVPAHVRLKADGDSMQAILPSLYGTDGWYVGEPGDYRIQAICQLPSDRVLASPVRILRVAKADLGGAKALESDLLSRKTGLYVALGGSRSPMFDATRENFERLKRDHPRLRVTGQAALLEDWARARPFKPAPGIANSSSRFAAAQRLLAQLDAAAGRPENFASSPDAMRSAQILLDAIGAAQAHRGPIDAKALATEWQPTINKILKDRGASPRILRWLQKLTSERLDMRGMS